MPYRTLVLPVLAVLASACGPNLQPITIQFRGQVASQDFACGQTYSGVGLAATQIQPADFRLYVHNLRLVDASGAELPLTLDQDMLWQYQNVALLDFENKTAPCDGTVATNDVISGQAPVPSGGYTGIRFLIGVPAELNHGNQATAPSPLNLSSLFWTWESGYKFLRTEGTVTGSASTFMVHLGSTGCTRDPLGQTQCVNLDTPTIDLAGFDPAKNHIAVDLAALLAGSDLSTDVACQSDPSTDACGPVFARLGLPWGSAAASGQSVFRVE